VCEQLALSRYLAVHRARVEPATSQSLVQHATITPLSYKYCAIIFTYSLLSFVVVMCCTAEWSGNGLGTGYDDKHDQRGPGS